MKKALAASLIALAAASGSASAADMDVQQQVGLIVSGVVDQWVGVQIIDNQYTKDDTVIANGTAVYLSLPLGGNISIQGDLLQETNSNAFEGRNGSALGPRYSFQGAGHLSWRDPSTFLFGGFGGVGRADSFGRPTAVNYGFAGGEAQIYTGDFTLYGQGGYADIEPVTWTRHVADEAYFARGVARWFLSPDSRLQFEGMWMNVSYDGRRGSRDRDVYSWGARYDTVLSGMPILGEMPVFVAYRGTFRDDCHRGSDQTDHTIMVGTSYTFSGTRIDIDRSGATLDTPNFGNAFTCNGGLRGGMGGGGGGGGETAQN